MDTKRYYPALVVLHWVSAIFLLLALGMGSQVLSALPNTDPGKLDALKGHMVVGAVILVLTVLRLLARATTVHPPSARTGMAFTDRLVPVMHWALYALVLVMIGSGIGMAKAFDLFTVVFNSQGHLPPDFHASAAQSVHGVASKLLGLAILGHLIAALFHQFVRRDQLFSRMRLGRPRND